MDENFKTSEISAKDGDILAEIRDLTKKNLFFKRLEAVCVMGMFLVVLIAALVVVPKVNTTLAHVNDVAQKAQEVATKAQDSLAKVDEMTESMKQASQDLNSLVDENGESLSAAIKSMSEVDYQGLNDAIKDLQGTVGPMASFMSKFR
jgi:methyl-accepting chemotaxis protein